MESYIQNRFFSSYLIVTRTKPTENLGMFPSTVKATIWYELTVLNNITKKWYGTKSKLIWYAKIVSLSPITISSGSRRLIG